MKKIIITISAFVIIAIIAFGILYKKDNKKNNDLKKITVAEVAHSIFYTPMYVASSLGYFTEEGLDVSIVLTSGADSVAASVISGDAQIGFCGSEQSIYIYNGGEKDYLINFAILNIKSHFLICKLTFLPNYQTYKKDNICYLNFRCTYSYYWTYACKKMWITFNFPASLKNCIRCMYYIYFITTFIK